MTPTSSAAAAEGLVVVSNRLPYDLPREGTRSSPKRNVGGLVNALEPVLARRGGTWIGWDGAALPSASAVHAALSRPRMNGAPASTPRRPSPVQSANMSAAIRNRSSVEGRSAVTLEMRPASTCARVP